MVVDGPTRERSIAGMALATGRYTFTAVASGFIRSSVISYLPLRITRDDPGASHIDTLDIETTHYKPARGEVVSVGIARHERGTPAEDATYHLVHRGGDGEAETIRRGLQLLADGEPEVLVSYNGKAFDLDFLKQRLHRLDVSNNSLTLPPAMHVDFFVDRQQRASKRDEKWPTLEECLESYELTPARTIWDGREVTNARFGEELGPAYLTALLEGDGDEQQRLRAVIEHYLRTDLEANLSLFYADIDETFEPMHLGSERAFPVV